MTWRSKRKTSTSINAYLCPAMMNQKKLLRKYQDVKTNGPVYNTISALIQSQMGLRSFKISPKLSNMILQARSRARLRYNMGRIGFEICRRYMKENRTWIASSSSKCHWIKIRPRIRWIQRTCWRCLEVKIWWFLWSMGAASPRATIWKVKAIKHCVMTCAVSCAQGAGAIANLQRSSPKKETRASSPSFSSSPHTQASITLRCSNVRPAFAEQRRTSRWCWWPCAAAAPSTTTPWGASINWRSRTRWPRRRCASWSTGSSNGSATRRRETASCRWPSRSWPNAA